MEEQLVTAVVILDLSAAFDTVDHDILLEALEKWSGRLWYQSYLKPRKFKVAIGKKISETRQLDISVYCREVYKGHSYSSPLPPPKRM